MISKPLGAKTVGSAVCRVNSTTPVTLGLRDAFRDKFGYTLTNLKKL
jgi:hypothetical protein